MGDMPLCAYAPTLPASDAFKEEFYEKLTNVIDSVPRRDKLFFLGDFNARVGRDYTSWCKVIGPHGVGREHFNGTLLLNTCTQYNLVITNTIFQQSNKYKTTWMHPRSHHWHLRDYVIVRQRDLRDVRQTRVMRSSSSWSDHRLVRCITSLVIKPKQHRQRLMPTKKLCVKRLFVKDIRCQFQDEIEYLLAGMTESSDIDCFWTDLKTKTFQCASDVLGHTKCKHQDWFDMNEPTIQLLLDSMREAHLGWIRDKSLTAKKLAYTSLRQSVQVKLRSLKENWWMKRWLITSI